MKIFKKRIPAIVFGIILLVMLTAAALGCGGEDDPADTTAQETLYTETAWVGPTASETAEAEGSVPESTGSSEKETEESEPEEFQPFESEPEESLPFASDPGEPETYLPETEESLPDKDGTYTSKEEVSLYLHVYGELPSNYLTKEEARELGWGTWGDLSKVAPGMSIGGDRFYNYEKKLPKAKGRVYYECDIDYRRGSRNEKRLVYSNDGLIFYTEDHYQTYEQLY